MKRLFCLLLLFLLLLPSFAFAKESAQPCYWLLTDVRTEKSASQPYGDASADASVTVFPGSVGKGELSDTGGNAAGDGGNARL